MYLIEPSALKLLDFVIGESASLEEQLLPNLISNGGKLFGLECHGKFIDIGTPEDYNRAQHYLNC